MEELDKKFIELYRKIGEIQGIDCSIAAIFAKLYIEPKEISMEELAKSTGYSLASISNKVHFIENISPLRKFRKPGSKKVFLYMEKDILSILRNAFLKKERYAVSIAKEKIPLIIDEYSKKATKKEKAKLRILKDYYNQIMKLETLLKIFIKTINKFEKIK